MGSHGANAHKARKSDQSAGRKVATTMNLTSWGNGDKVHSTKVPVLAVQEHKLDRERLKEVSASLKKLGNTKSNLKQNNLEKNKKRM